MRVRKGVEGEISWVPKKPVGSQFLGRACAELQRGQWRVSQLRCHALAAVCLASSHGQMPAAQGRWRKPPGKTSCRYLKRAAAFPSEMKAGAARLCSVHCWQL